MRSGRLRLHRDYEAPRQFRSDSDENEHHPKASLETLLRVNNAKLAPVPDMMLENPLPPNLVVTEPFSLKYVPKFMGNLPREHLSEAQTRYDYALRI